MATDQYHEPPQELPEHIRTLTRMLTSLTEEVEAIGWYVQRISVEKDPAARAIMQNAMEEEFKHSAMDLEFVLRKLPKWQKIAKEVLFRAGDIVEHGEEAEESAGLS